MGWYGICQLNKSETNLQLCECKSEKSSKWVDKYTYLIFAHSTFDQSLKNWLSRIFTETHFFIVVITNLESIICPACKLHGAGLLIKREELYIYLTGGLENGWAKPGYITILFKDEFDFDVPC